MHHGRFPVNLELPKSVGSLVGMQLTITIVLDEAGRLAVQASAPIDPPVLVGLLEIAKQSVIGGLQRPDRPAVQTAPASILHQLNGGRSP